MRFHISLIRSSTSKSVLLPLLISVVFIAGGAGVCQASALTVNPVAGTLSAKVDQMPIQMILTELSQKSGIAVFLDTSLLSKKVTAKFKNLGLEEGIKKLVSPYSSAMVFGKRKNARGQEELFLSEVKVYDSSNKNAAFAKVGEKGLTTASGEKDMAGKKTITVASAPPQIKNPAAAAAMRKKVSASILRTQLVQKHAMIQKQQQKMRHEELQSLRRIQQMEEQLQMVPEKERYQMQARLSQLKVNLNNTRQRNAHKLRTLQMESSRLKYQQAQYGAVLNDSSEPTSN